MECTLIRDNQDGRGLRGNRDVPAVFPSFWAPASNSASRPGTSITVHKRIDLTGHATASPSSRDVTLANNYSASARQRRRSIRNGVDRAGALTAFGSFIPPATGRDACRPPQRPSARWFRIAVGALVRGLRRCALRHCCACHHARRAERLKHARDRMHLLPRARSTSPPSFPTHCWHLVILLSSTDAVAQRPATPPSLLTRRLVVPTSRVTRLPRGSTRCAF